MPPAEKLPHDDPEFDAEIDPETDSGAPADEPPADVPLLPLRDGLPRIVDTDAGLAEVCAALAAGTGPVAIDAERASGYQIGRAAGRERTRDRVGLVAL